MRKGGLLGLALFLVVLVIVGLIALTFIGLGLLGIFGFGHEKWFSLSNCHCECSTMEAGEVREIGTYNGSKVHISNLVGRLVVEEGNSPLVIYSNLPINVSQVGDEVLITCNECNKYKDGKIIVKGNLSELEIGDVLGKVEVEVPLRILKVGDIMGELEVHAPVGVFESGDIMGRVSVKALKLVDVEDVLGELKVMVPEGYGVNLKVDDIMGKIKNEAKGEKKVKVNLEDVMGRVEIING
ncbi:DUF4097 family beta strand repeat-containing protein [Pyrococcus abyssi]|uniref:Uncharacterized protein n=1 Tax=Pyrococcus abyssi (strain GE5 / Orsay) TaxID=272844 RepID=Q9V1F7_PYRAB|nr:hypothetical protein [Pyrococcus abyssi]CAB49392.1 Hypothetical protein PAB0312 [Pyrococcus abyssi GE5]CCE69853.1 TPA: hypothetical protein PAB0312 [Pyrococcus abyssi GE5]